MSEIIDRAARALRDAVANDPHCDVSDCSRFDNEDDLSAVRLHGELDLRALVRVVLATARKPTKAMRDAGAEECTDYDGGSVPQEVRANTAEWAWQAMIDAALAEGTEAATPASVGPGNTP